MKTSHNVLYRLALIGAGALLVTTAFAASPRGKLVIDQHVDQGEVLANNGNGEPIQLAATSQVVALVQQDGERHRLRLIGLHHAESDLFWWTYEWMGPEGRPNHIIDFDRRFTVHVTADEIMAMEVLAPPISIWWLRSTQKVSSSEGGQRQALLAIENAFLSERSLPVVRLNQANLTHDLPRGFAHEAHRRHAKHGARILSLEPHEDGWSITVAGRNGRVALVELDAELAIATGEEIIE